MPPGQNRLSISIAPVNRTRGQHYADLPGTVRLMQDLLPAGVVDGFEFQNLAEWDAVEPPRDERDKRLADWQHSARYTVDELAAALREAGMPILSVHANRDVGICLCTGERAAIERGRQLIHQSLRLAQQVGAPVCVFHFWDTWKESFDPGFLRRVLHEVAPQYPAVRAAVENVPTHLAGGTPFDLVKGFPWITLDLRWAALYDELDRFQAVKDRLANIHLRGHLENGRWAMANAPFSFDEALHIIKDQWGYTGLWTMEPERAREGTWEDLLAAMAALRASL